MHVTVPREWYFPPTCKLSHSLPPVPRGPVVWAVCPPWTLASHPAPEPGAHEEEEGAVLRQQTAFHSVVTRHHGCHRLGCHRLWWGGCGVGVRVEPAGGTSRSLASVCFLPEPEFPALDQEPETRAFTYSRSLKRQKVLGPVQKVLG